MRRLVFGVLTALMLGCGASESDSKTDSDEGSDSTTQGALKCKSRAGRTYRVTYVERSGDCGPITEEVVTAQPGSGAPGSDLPDGCTSGTSITSADGCEAVSKDLVCSGGGQTATLNGKITWNPEGSSASGAISFQVQTATGSCSGSYDLTYTEL